MRKTLLLLLIPGCTVCCVACKPSPPPGMTDPGQLIYLGYKDTYASCSRCHGDAGQGGIDSPSIRNAVSKLGRRAVKRIIIFGKSDGKKKMPAFGEELTPEEIDQVLGFITNWGVPDSLKKAQPGSQTNATE